MKCPGSNQLVFRWSEKNQQSKGIPFGICTNCKQEVRTYGNAQALAAAHAHDMPEESNGQ